MPQIYDEEKLKQIEEQVINLMKNIYDPEIPADIYNLGLIYNINFEQRENYLHCEVDMTLTSPTCPVADMLVEQVRYATQSVAEIDEVKVNLVFEPVWGPEMMSEDAKEMMAANGAAMF